MIDLGEKVDELDKKLDFKALAPPLLAPMIEENFFKNSILKDVIEEYLSHPILEGIKALILGCTHYPLIKEVILNFYQTSIDVIDSSEIVANALKDLIEKHNLNNTASHHFRKFYVSDYTKSFEKSAQIFFREAVQLEHYPLWE